MCWLERGREKEKEEWRGGETEGKREREKGGRQGRPLSLYITPAPCPQGCSSPSTAAPLQAWAIYKGKHLEGTDKEDPSTWKTRLRCALNKSADFCEVRERSQLDISNPYKVYRIVSNSALGPGTVLLLEVVAKDGSLGNKDLPLHICKMGHGGLTEFKLMGR